MGWEFWDHHPCGQSEPLWVGDVDIILSLWSVQVNLKFHGRGNFDIILSPWAVQEIEVPWGWEFSYHLILVGSPSQFEVPWGWEFWYHLILADSPSQFEVPWGWEF